MWIASTEISYFDKCTFMNLTNFAEYQGAKELFLLVSRDNPRVKSYKSLFKVIDAARVKAHEIQQLIKKGLQASSVLE